MRLLAVYDRIERGELAGVIASGLPGLADGTHTMIWRYRDCTVRPITVSPRGYPYVRVTLRDGRSPTRRRAGSNPSDLRSGIEGDRLLRLPADTVQGTTPCI